MKAGFTESSKLCPKTCYMNMKQIPGYKILICSFLLMSRYICLINKVLLQHLLWNTHWWHNSYISHVIDYNVLSKKRTQAFPESSSPVVSSTRPFTSRRFGVKAGKQQLTLRLLVSCTLAHWDTFGTEPSLTKLVSPVLFLQWQKSSPGATDPKYLYLTACHFLKFVQ